MTKFWRFNVIHLDRVQRAKTLHGEVIKSYFNQLPFKQCSYPVSTMGKISRGWPSQLFLKVGSGQDLPSRLFSKVGSGHDLPSQKSGWKSRDTSWLFLTYLAEKIGKSRDISRFSPTYPDLPQNFKKSGWPSGMAIPICQKVGMAIPIRHDPILSGFYPPRDSP